MNKIINCSDCRCERGELQDFFRIKELCPLRHGQLASCECIHTVLELNEEEGNAVYEYNDDFEDPLKSIVARWKKEINNKGRIHLGKDLGILGIDS